MEELIINRIELIFLAFLVLTISSCIGAATQFDVKPGDSIQATVNCAHSGDTIIVEPGTYVGNIEISKTNDLNDLVLMSASGNPADTIIIANNSAPDTVQGVISILKLKTNVTVKGFTISGAEDSMAGVYFSDQGKQCIIENNVFLDDGYGVNVNGSSDNVISNNYFTKTKAIVRCTAITGINIANSSNTMISQNLVSNQDIGIHITGSNSKGNSVSGNSVNNNSKYGIELEQAKGVTVDGNTVNSNSVSGIYLSGSSENYVTNNNVVMPSTVVNGTNTNAIQLVVYDVDANTHVGSDSNVVSGNTVSGADHGIFLNGCKNNTIQSNTASGNNYGIAMRYSNNNRVINNNADKNAQGNGEGLYFTLTDSGNTISGNSASECLIGIHLSQECGENNLVDNNIVNSNQYNGIYVEAPNNKISNNSASGNGRGIFLIGPNCARNTISNNIVKNSVGGHGIYLLNTGYNNKLVSNSLISNSNNGIQLFNSNNSYIDSNYAQENTMGFQVENSNGVTINNNTAFGNSIGFRLHYSNNNTLSKNNATYNSPNSGIDMNAAEMNTITGNSITWNEKGITMCPACRNNLIYNNYFNNNENTGVRNADNIWHVQRPTKGKNIVSGPYIGGNYWASLGNDGFSQTAPDTNGDGIADTIFTYTNPEGITITDSLPLVSVVLPVADFSFNPTQGIAPLTVQFNDLSQNADSRSWDFGDGTNSTEQNPIHTYSAVGTYNVKLTVSNENDIVSKLATVTVQAYITSPITPVADFNVNPTSGDAPLTVQFTDSSQNAVRWTWSFGDGATSTEQNPTHTYFSAGNYIVSLTVNNANGTDSKIATVTVDSNADLSIYNSVIGIDETGNQIIDNPGDVINYQIAIKNRGDVNLTGVSVIDQMCVLIGPNGDGIDPGVLHPGEAWVYTGNYTVTQDDINSNGYGSGSIENIATINCNELSSRSCSVSVPIIQSTPVLPVANFRSNVTSGFAPLSVQFIDLSENAISRNWVFGDSTNSTDPNPEHTYSTSGNYTVIQIASNENGYASKVATITVSEPPKVPLVNSSDTRANIYSPVTVKIGDFSINATTLNWNFGSRVHIADINNSGTNVSAPVTVQIGNFSINATTLNWNFGSSI